MLMSSLVKNVSHVFAEDISDYGQRILLALNYFVQLAQVANPANTSIIFEINKGRTFSFTFLLDTRCR
jgi:hypothetical protein